MQDARSSTPSSLPPDVPACHALIAELSTAIVALQSAQEKLSQENVELNLTIQKLLAQLRGHRRERHADPAQQQLDFGDDAAEGLAAAAAEQEAVFEEVTIRRRIKSRQPRNEQLPEHLPRYEVTAEVPAEEQQCDEHGPKQIIGYDVTETLEFERPKLRGRVTKYPKYACPSHPECGVVQPPRPENPLVEGDRYDTSRPPASCWRCPRRDHHRQIRFPPAGLSAAGLVRRQRLDARPLDAAEHSGQCGLCLGAALSALCRPRSHSPGDSDR